MLFAFFLVFRHKARWDTLGEVIADLSSEGVMGLVDCGLTIAFVLARVPPTLGKILSTFVGFLGNFSLRRLLVFPQPGAVRT